MKIAVNDGHTLTGAGSGAIGIVSESIVVRKIGNRLREYLKSQGHTVVNCTVDKANSQAEYLRRAVKIANDARCDMFISIHLNCANKKAKGCEVYTYRGKEIKQAKESLKNLASLGFTMRKGEGADYCKDGSNLYVLHNTNMTAYLIEVFFCDNKEDVNLYNKVGVGAIARALAKPYGSIKATGSSSKTDKVNKATYYPKCTSNAKSISDALKSIGVKNTYENRAKIAKANGIVGNVKEYKGSTEQNLKMLSLLKVGKLKRVRK